MQAENASFWRRAAAFIIDAGILGAGGYLIGFTLARAWESTFTLDWQGRQDMQSFVSLVLLGTAWLYFALFESGAEQATPGKRLLRLRVSQMDGREVGFWRASARFGMKLISALLLGFGFWMALFTKSKRTLHDRAAGTQVLVR